jgi:hypothetical protein
MNTSTTTSENAMHLDLTENERAALIAQRLGGTHALAYPDDNLPSRFNLDLPNAGVPNARLFLCFSPHNAKGRVQISCRFPPSLSTAGACAKTYLSNDELAAIGFVQSITVVETKTSEQIAKEIERRLLPGYLKALEAANRGNVVEQQELAQRVQFMKRLGDLTGEHLTDEDIKRERIYVRNLAGESMDVTMSGDKVNLNIRWVSPELAEKVIALFKAST